MNSAALCLLGGPIVVKNGRRLEIPEGSKRLLVFVALNGGRVSRRHAAGTLWPCGDDERAAGNLRSALWRLRGAGLDLLHAEKHMLYLDPELSVDITRLSQWATRVINGSADGSDLGTRELNPEAVHLLPGWYDDWVIFERERLRQRLLHAMESLVRHLISRGLLVDAVEVATTAVGVEPLRESAQRVLIEAHLAEGNFVEARRIYMAYHEMLGAELGVSPSVELAEIVSCHRKIGALSLDRRRSVEAVDADESEVGGGAGQVLTARATGAALKQAVAAVERPTPPDTSGDRIRRRAAGSPRGRPVITSS